MVQKKKKKSNCDNIMKSNIDKLTSSKQSKYGKNHIQKQNMN